MFLQLRAGKAGIFFSFWTENFENNDIVLICTCFLGTIYHNLRIFRSLDLNKNMF